MKISKVKVGVAMPNIILMTVDSRRSGYVDCYGNSEVQLSEETYNLKDDLTETMGLNSLQTDEVRRVKKETMNSLSQFKEAKKEQATTLESEMVRKRIERLSKPLRKNDS